MIKGNNEIFEEKPNNKLSSLKKYMSTKNKNTNFST